MGKTRRIYVGTIEFDPRDLTKNQGHEYGAGRPSQVFRHKNKRRERQRQKMELRRYY